MKLINIENIKNKYHHGWKRKKNKVYQIVVHGTGGGHSAEDLINWMYNSGRKGYYKGIGLFHYAIDKNGDVYNILKPDRWVYHSTSGRHDKRTIGVELINSSKDNSDGYTDAQYQSLFLLFEHLRDEGYNIKSFISHKKVMWIYSKLKKKCPGNFDWDKLIDYLEGEDYEFSVQGSDYIKGIE